MRKLVVCVGNPLRADDGFAVSVGKVLRERGIEAVVSGPDLTDIADLLADAEELVLVDAVDFGGKPGEVISGEAEDLDEVELRSSTHTLSPLKFLKVLRELTGYPKRIFLVGVQPAHLGFGEGFSPEVERAVSSVVEVILDKLGDRE